MLPDSKKLLSDALRAAIAIEGFTAGHCLDDLAHNELLRSGVYWQFVIIGEAMSQLQRADPSTFGRITECKRIVAFRNQIIHGYGLVSDTITWQIIIDKLPVLRRDLETLLSE